MKMYAAHGFTDFVICCGYKAHMIKSYFVNYNPYNPATQYIVKSCDIDKDAVLLRPGRLRGLFDNGSFKSIETKTILSVPPKGAFLTRVDRMFGHLPFGAQYYLSATRT